MSGDTPVIFHPTVCSIEYVHVFILICNGIITVPLLIGSFNFSIIFKVASLARHKGNHMIVQDPVPGK